MKQMVHNEAMQTKLAVSYIKCLTPTFWNIYEMFKMRFTYKDFLSYSSSNWLSWFDTKGLKNPYTIAHTCTHSQTHTSNHTQTNTHIYIYIYTFTDSQMHSVLMVKFCRRHKIMNVTDRQYFIFSSLAASKQQNIPEYTG